MARLFFLFALLACCLPASARAQPRIWSTPLEEAHNLEHFHDALRALERDPSRRVRVLHFGDSNVAADLWTDVARTSLQARFGDGGSGYLLPDRFGSWHRGAVSVRTEGAWQSRRLGFGHDFGPADGLWGIAGVGVEPATAGARIIVHVPAGATGERVFELHLLARDRPNGAVTVTVDDARPQRVDAHHDRPGLILRRWTLDAGEHRIVVRRSSGRPRVLGTVVERANGVVYDVLGINGHRASALLQWNQDLLRAQLAHRRPDLVILSYGGNEALDPSLSLDAYESQTREAVLRVRRLTTGASCLLVGPVGTTPIYAGRMQAVTDIQRRLAAELGCGFWDPSVVSGGHGYLLDWARYPEMVGGDTLHLGREGYRIVGEQFVAAILTGL